LTGRFEVPSERTFRRVLADLDADALDTATCGFTMDVVRGTAPVPDVPRTPGPLEREERRALQRADQNPAPAGLLPGAAVDGKMLRGARTDTGRVFLEHLNHYERRHWSVENRLHWVRDVTFREDHSQLRTGTAPRALASFRNLGISTFRLGGRAHIAHARRDLLSAGARPYV
jgi:hypothetical protein